MNIINAVKEKKSYGHIKWRGDDRPVSQAKVTTGTEMADLTEHDAFKGATSTPEELEKRVQVEESGRRGD